MTRIIFFSLCLWFTANTQAQEIFSAQKGSSQIRMLALKDSYRLQSFELDLILKKQKCSQGAVDSFIKNFEGLFKRSLSLGKKGDVRVLFGQKGKQVTSQSDLGKYVTNFSNHIITLKKEAGILCK